MQSVENRLTRSPFDPRPASICGQLVSLLLAYLFRVRDTSEQSGGRILFVNCRSWVVHCSAQVVRVCFHWPLSVCCVCVAVQSALIFRVSVGRVCATAFQPWWLGRFLSIKTCKHSYSALHNKFRVVRLGHCQHRICFPAHSHIIPPSWRHRDRWIIKIKFASSLSR